MDGFGTLDADSIRHHLQGQFGLDASSPRQVLRLADLGVVVTAWRNGPIEDIHARLGGLSDGELLRINSHTTWRVRGITGRWLREVGFGERGNQSRGWSICHEDLETLVSRWYRWVANPNRVLPGGAPLHDSAGVKLEEVQLHAERALFALLPLARRYGVDAALLSLALQGAVFAGHWWGHPRWPNLVERFIRSLDHPHKSEGISEIDWVGLQTPEPPEVSDRPYLAGVLLAAPWQLQTATADWLIKAGIGSS